MHLIGIVRLGRDAEVRYLPDGRPVANLALAFNYGKKDSNGDRPTQWIDAALFGDRVEKLQQYLTKGAQVMVHLSDPHIETYQKSDGSQGVKLSAFIANLEFAGGNNRNSAAGPAQQGGQQRNGYAAATGRAQPQSQQGGGQAQQRGAGTFDDMGDDIPFS